ncbi:MULTISPECIES: hypothetical protein [unclassified Bradyrhizobium]|uniref:hypothetical protein n=1 Tax=unclassified Bradyrhizobium TaxID=2631580 RepID=UPI002916BAD0|nr:MULTISPECIES: hypothetical protein [unclassified Bradyrhizobium]
MPIYELDNRSVTPLTEITFASKNILEQDIQIALRSHIQAIAPDTMVLAEEFGDWADSWRSIDLLCLDKEANLVVIELKRTEDGGHMELQAIRYAAMVSNMTFADAVAAHDKFLKKRGLDGAQADNAILTFLGWEEPRGQQFAQDVRIILVSASFSKEITTTVLWLNERDLDIRCVRVRPYELNGKVLIDVHQVVPLPEVAEYQVQLRRKAAEERKSSVGGLDWTRYDLQIGNDEYTKLYKRALFLASVKGFVKSGVAVLQLQQVLPSSKFLSVPGQVDGPEFRKAAAEMRTPSGAPYDLKRFYTDDGDLFFSDGKTWALSNQWSIDFLPQLDQLIAKYPDAKISYSAA